VCSLDLGQGDISFRIAPSWTLTQAACYDRATSLRFSPSPALIDLRSSSFGVLQFDLPISAGNLEQLIFASSVILPI